MRVKGFCFTKLLVLSFAILVDETLAEEMAKIPDADSVRNYLFNVFEKGSTDASADVSLKPYAAFFNSGFQPKRFWSDEKISFGYGKNSEGDVVLVTWVHSKENPAISLADAKESFLDGLFALIKSEDQLSEWQSIRKDVAGAMMNLRLGEAKAEFADGRSLQPTDRLEKQMVGYSPFVVLIESSSKGRPILSASRNTN
jgi:hypothetical protein